MHIYNHRFFSYIEKGAIRSSQAIVPVILKKLYVLSVLDVGCGHGAWLKTWIGHGITAMGIDGNYINTDDLLVPKDHFISKDLKLPFNLNKNFSLVQCLEVAEHLPASCAESFVNSLCLHSDLILFSAATPGQGGENHVNEKPYSYWRNLFKKQGFIMTDPFRKELITFTDVDPWYKYNTFLFLRHEKLNEELQALNAFVVPIDKDPIDLSPLLYKIRKYLINFLPIRVITMLSKIKQTGSLFQRQFFY